jgi:N-acetylglutamate synthase-like GNAT family acetyltransferase
VAREARAQEPISMIVVRPATAADQKTIKAIIRAVQINPMDLQWPNFVLAVDQDSSAIVGTAQIKQHGDGSRELASIATVPSQRQRGIAHQLINHLLAEHQGTLYLTCLDTMESFYEQFGFRSITTTEMTPYFRRLMRIAGTFRFVSDEGRRLRVMQRG